MRSHCCYGSTETVGRGDRKLTGALCPLKRLVPGARDLIIGDRLRPDPVWETAPLCCSRAGGLPGVDLHCHRLHGRPHDSASRLHP
jgi:hypothetical protein